MSTRSQRLGDDLTADLLADLADEDRIVKQAGISGITPTPTPEPVAAIDGTAIVVATQPFVETTLYLSPRAWLQAGLRRTDEAVTLTAGPLRFTAGRR